MEMFREKIPLYNLEVRSIKIIFKEIKIRHDLKKKKETITLTKNLR